MNVVVFGLKMIEDFSLCLLMSTVALRVHATYWAFLAYKSIRGKCLIHDIIIQQACHSCNTGNTNMGLVDILRPQGDAAGLCQDIWTVAVLKGKSRNKQFTHQKTDKTGSKAHQGTVVPEQQTKEKNWSIGIKDATTPRCHNFSVVKELRGGVRKKNICSACFAWLFVPLEPGGAAPSSCFYSSGQVISTTDFVPTAIKARRHPTLIAISERGWPLSGQQGARLLRGCPSVTSTVRLKAQTLSWR